MAAQMLCHKWAVPSDTFAVERACRELGKCSSRGPDAKTGASRDVSGSCTPGHALTALPRCCLAEPCAGPSYRIPQAFYYSVPCSEGAQLILAQYQPFVAFPHHTRSTQLSCMLS